MASRSEGFLCHRSYRSEVPFMRIFFAVLFSALFLQKVYPGSMIFLPLALLGLLWSIRQFRLARAKWELEGTILRNTLLGKTRELDLSEGYLVSRASVQCMQVKNRGGGYAQMQFYVFSRLPSGFRYGILGYGGPGAIRRLLENNLFLLPLSEDTAQLVQALYPGLYPGQTIPEYPAYTGPKA